MIAMVPGIAILPAPRVARPGPRVETQPSRFRTWLLVMFATLAAEPAPQAAPQADSGPPNANVRQAEVTARANLRAGPGTNHPVRAVIAKGERVQVLGRQGAWLNVRRIGHTAPAQDGWMFSRLLRMLPRAESDRGQAQRRAAGSAEEGTDQPSIPDRASPGEETNRVAEADAASLARARPGGRPIEWTAPAASPSQVPAPEPALPRELLPMPDRWRIVKSLGLLRYDPWDPYNPNVIKGDLPIRQAELGKGWFFNLSAASDTVLEARELPLPAARGTSSPPPAGRQWMIKQTGLLGLSLVKGDSVFRPPDLEVRFAPAVSYSYTGSRAMPVDGSPATTSSDSGASLGVQELFVGAHLRDVSPRYDFDSIRVGVQPFTADFRGFLLIDQAFGVRLFGTRDNNRWQYNLAWLQRLEKNTITGLNAIDRPLRDDHILVANLYRQDWPVAGFTTQSVVLYDRNREGSGGAFFDSNGNLARPPGFATAGPYDYDVTYLGANGDGHFGRWNLTASAYYATGDVEPGVLSGRSEHIGAYFCAFELSRDFDWIRLRLSGLFGSGDGDPYDGKAGGYDSVLESPLFAGAETSYWIRQAIPVPGGGGAVLSIRNGVLASLRSSREHGQSNFTNPGLRLLGLGADVDLAPGLRLTGNMNYLEFDDVSSLEAISGQRLGSTRIGTDLSLAVQYRPLFSQNVVIGASAAVLFPGGGMRELYGTAIDQAQWTTLFDLLLAF